MDVLRDYEIAEIGEIMRRVSKRKRKLERKSGRERVGEKERMKIDKTLLLFFILIFCAEQKKKFFLLF